MIAHLDQIRTADGVRLSYVVRERLIAEVNETFGHAEPFYASHNDELTTRYPIIAGVLGFDGTQTEDQMTQLKKNGPFTARFVHDREVVYNLLKDSFDELDD